MTVQTLEHATQPTEELRTVIPGRTRVLSRATAEGYQEAAEIYEKGVPEWGFRMGWAAEDYAEWLANTVGVGDRRVRTYLRRFARRDWKAFEMDITNPRLSPIDMIDHLDVRHGGHVGWITTTHYLNSHRTVVIRGKPTDIEDALAKLQAAHYTVHAYGDSWYRAWPGVPSPVRTAQEILEARQQMANGTFFIPEDYHLAPGQIDLAYDL